MLHFNGRWVRRITPFGRRGNYQERLYVLGALPKELNPYEPIARQLEEAPEKQESRNRGKVNVVLLGQKQTKLIDSLILMPVKYSVYKRSCHK
jgi:hypothetical protein